jgi:hypothetical protein
MQERDYFDESESAKPANLTCPYCRQAGEYPLRWLVRKKKQRLPPRADADDRARFDKAQSYMVLRDDKVQCSNNRCRKRFDISGVKSVVLL